LAIELTVIGASTASPGPDEESACYVVNGSILIDTGWNAAHSMLALGLVPTAIDHVVFTHCHQDHTLGLPGLFFAQRQRQQIRPDAPDMRLYGPMDLPAVCDGAKALLQAERYPQCVPDHQIDLVYPGDTLEINGLRLDVGRAFHPLDARCYRFTDTASGASVVFGGDTAYHEGLPLFARDCDVLIHEAAAAATAKPEGMQRYLHSRPQDAARVAQESGAGELVLVHYSGAGEGVVEQAKETFAAARLGRRGDHLSLAGPGQARWSVVGRPV
jgi:ribonuclease Z